MLPRVQLDLPVHTTVTPLGPDCDAIHAEHRSHRVFDLGLGAPAAQFWIRAREPGLIREMSGTSGKAFPDVLARLGYQIRRSSPQRVVQTAIGRAEVFAPIPQPGDKTPTGPHTHLLPQYLDMGLETPPGAELPAFYVPGALFYPANDDILERRSFRLNQGGARAQD